MDNYYVTKKMKTNGYHVVHTQDCSLLPDLDDVFYLGYFSNCLPAIEKAKRYYQHVTGCEECSELCAVIEEEIILKKHR
jgi:hypothetical protein